MTFYICNSRAASASHYCSRHHSARELTRNLQIDLNLSLAFLTPISTIMSSSLNIRRIVPRLYLSQSVFAVVQQQSSCQRPPCAPLADVPPISCPLSVARDIATRL
jgi:hypothetical protein